jgi:predicted nuclease of restriction endonuclease-like (RecB) superfamily
VAQIKAAIKVNYELLNLYWELGKEISEKQKKTNWGESLIDQLSKDLSKAFPGVKGFSRANLFFIRKWFLFYQNAEKVSQLVRQIPWGHNREIIVKCADIEEAVFYGEGTIQNNWSRAILLMQIGGNLYNRQGKAIHNFQETSPTPQASINPDLETCVRR